MYNFTFWKAIVDVRKDLKKAKFVVLDRQFNFVPQVGMQIKLNGKYETVRECNYNEDWDNFIIRLKRSDNQKYVEIFGDNHEKQIWNIDEVYREYTKNGWIGQNYEAIENIIR